MKRLVTACALFVLLIGGCFWEYQTVSRTTDTLALAVSGQTDPAVLTACFDDWQACRPLLASLVRHAELDQIDTLYRRAIQAARNHDQNEARLQVAELSGALRHIAEMEFPSQHNIL